MGKIEERLNLDLRIGNKGWEAASTNFRWNAQNGSAILHSQIFWFNELL